MASSEGHWWEHWALEDIIDAIEQERTRMKTKKTTTNGHPTPGRLLGDELAMTFYSDMPGHRGFTKREEIAKEMMKAIVTGDPNVLPKAAAHDALEYADALLEELAQG